MKCNVNVGEIDLKVWRCARNNKPLTDDADQYIFFILNGS